MSIIITGIGTGVGKTVVSAALLAASDLYYWKPVQSGDLDQSDTLTVRSLTQLPEHRFLPEAYRLTHPLSPHASAALDEVTIERSQLTPPPGNLIIEGAGGPFVPLTDTFLLADLFQEWQIPVMIVSQAYLGSINHTISCVEALRARDIPIAGLIFNGERNHDSERAILATTGVNLLGSLPLMETIQKEQLQEAGSQWWQQLKILEQSGTLSHS